MPDNTQRISEENISLFMSLFAGRNDVYGTYDPATGKVCQIKAPVTREVIRAHLEGIRPCGVYPLVGNRIRFLAVDFDKLAPQPDLEFIAAARRFEIPAYLERSKSKGFHAWIFFESGGAAAWKARLVVRRLLEDIDAPATEIFPKQDRLAQQIAYGNFINAPLFGAYIQRGRTVFLDPEAALAPYPNQWALLENIQRVPERLLDKIIDMYDLVRPESPLPVKGTRDRVKFERGTFSLGLPPCAQRMLREGVHANQRISCFRLAIGLKKAGLPYDLALATLKAWALKNKPDNGKGVITEREVVAQAAWAYDRDYKGCGCQEPAILCFCDSRCPIGNRRQSIMKGK